MRLMVLFDIYSDETFKVKYLIQERISTETQAKFYDQIGVKS